MGDKTDVWQGTLALMILKTLETIGPQHGYGLARRIEQTSGDLLQLNYGTLYPALLKLEQEGYVRSEWGTSDNNRRAKFYEITKAGQKQVRKAAAEWEQTTEILSRFLAPQRDRECAVRAFCALIRCRRCERSRRRIEKTSRIWCTFARHASAGKQRQ